MRRKGKMVEEQIDSKFLNETITLKWYQPEAFTPLNKYHLCIMQDGDDYFQMGRVATLSDRLHDEYEIENTIFVGIHYNDKYDRQDKYHPSGKKQSAYIRFLTQEVLPFLEDTLPTHQVAGGRTLMGDSLAGTLALQVAVSHPNLIGQVIMQSPYVNETIMEIINQSTSLDTLTIYHTIGTDEENVVTTSGETKNFLTPNRALKKLMEQKQASYIYHELPGKHTWKAWQDDLPRALTTMFRWD
ncbi:alpha/beta hydrolase-fold protein [Aquibacillus koreensis]|uniref:Alpha/beta hydrolase-fold protein n=1 Tax=Aquibacillus koreensis TaxID=279446 RepID=A0A9X3WHU1_9BACI|nr:alpha/beta hydrolase-fold protein [Aquibacillus koreensis]MCT2535683.1 alpha/beta hydrolase-fold protein [Aquibacillus koreensis]MDC3420032.1 alpha/beta hydrolase-fold protein [Aquibacillus koreensis]